jgi:hypothetical protein
MQIIASQYSNLFVWVDEWRSHEVDQKKMQIFRSAFGRGGQFRWTEDKQQRQFKTNFIVSGESTTSDAATRSRFALVQVAASLRRENHWDWFEVHREHSYLFFRYVLENRVEFVQRVMAHIQDWRSSPDTRHLSERDKLVYGVGTAAFMAMAEMLGVYEGIELRNFRQFMIGMAASASKDVSSSTNLMNWWQEIISGVESHDIPIELFAYESEPTELTGLPGPPGHRKIELYFNAAALLEAHQRYLAKSHREPVLSQKDLRDQMKHQPYWLGNKKKSINRVTQDAWGINLDRHPMGTQHLTQEEFDALKADDPQSDPRQGPLFGIINRIKAKKNGEA